ncbi:30S ribosomal protein S21 [Candidatus Saccharibacteria bacterium]|nr:30S ribosomal protein S21 [Candidatus Saccharibacteria bacterium]
MIQVVKKDPKESTESLLRRFTRKVQQSGMMAITKQNQYFEKPLSKKERRERAIIRNQRKNQKTSRTR